MADHLQKVEVEKKMGQIKMVLKMMAKMYLGQNLPHITNKKKKDVKGECPNICLGAW